LESQWNFAAETQKAGAKAPAEAGALRPLIGSKKLSAPSCAPKMNVWSNGLPFSPEPYGSSM
jgi:hypothetical protein